MSINIENIVFSAGSMGGLTFVGAWKALEELGLTTEICNLSGCSAGSIMAFLVSIGFCSDELETIAINFRYKDLAEFRILYTFNNLGLESGDEIERLLRELLFYKIGVYDLTFRQHRIITGRNLWINASCVEQDKPYYFSSVRSPDMSVIKAVRMSISIPIIMAPVKHNGLTFIDGAFHDPCPVGMFGTGKTLVLLINNDHNIGAEEYEFTQYITMLIKSVYDRLHISINQRVSPYNVVWLDSGIGGLTLDIKKSTRRKLIRIGYNKLLQYLRARNSTIQ
jgi:NTE family protein